MLRQPNWTLWLGFGLLRWFISSLIIEVFSRTSHYLRFRDAAIQRTASEGRKSIWYALAFAFFITVPGSVPGGKWYWDLIPVAISVGAMLMVAREMGKSSVKETSFSPAVDSEFRRRLGLLASSSVAFRVSPEEPQPKSGIPAGTTLVLFSPEIAQQLTPQELSALAARQLVFQQQRRRQSKSFWLAAVGAIFLLPSLYALQPLLLWGCLAAVAFSLFVRLPKAFLRLDYQLDDWAARHFPGGSEYADAIRHADSVRVIGEPAMWWFQTATLSSRLEALARIDGTVTVKQGNNAIASQSK
jgi:hypothetical protein